MILGKVTQHHRLRGSGVVRGFVKYGLHMVHGVGCRVQGNSNPDLTSNLVLAGYFLEESGRQVS